MRPALSLLLVALLSGCASFTKPDNEIRITEYGGEGSYLMQASGAIGGCRIIEMGATAACVRYKGEACNVVSAACAGANREK
jgi:hypothetical protein